MELEAVPRGLLDPDSCRNKRCKTTKREIMNGRRKCRAKNRVRVAVFTPNPPHIHSTVDFPT